MTHAMTNNVSVRQLHPELIPLEPDDFQWAVQRSDLVLGERCQWQTYLNGLALMGFTTWLQERSPNTWVQSDACSLWQPETAAVVAAVYNLQIGEFSLCLLAMEQAWDEQVKVPRAVLDLPEFAAHFYVAIEVQEDQEQVVIQGIARYDQLDAQRRSHPLTAHADWSYSLPLDWFDPEPNHLLLYLRVLNPAAISLPLITSTPSSNLPALEPDTLPQLFTTLKTSDCDLWRYLSWEQGKAMLLNPELLQLYHQWRQSPTTETSPALRLMELFTLTLHQAVQLGRWLQGELDQAAERLGMFFPPVATVAPMLSIDRFEAAIAELRHQGMEIPPQPSRAYHDLDWQEVPLRLCIVTWQDTRQDTSPDAQLPWSVLFILGMQTQQTLPDGLKLRVSNAIGALHEPIVEFDDPFLFARVQGQQGDIFVVTICHVNCPPLTLPPYQLALA